MDTARMTPTRPGLPRDTGRLLLPAPRVGHGLVLGNESPPRWPDRYPRGFSDARDGSAPCPGRCDPSPDTGRTGRLHPRSYTATTVVGHPVSCRRTPHLEQPTSPHALRSPSTLRHGARITTGGESVPSIPARIGPRTRAWLQSPSPPPGPAEPRY